MYPIKIIGFNQTVAAINILFDSFDSFSYQLYHFTLFTCEDLYFH